MNGKTETEMRPPEKIVLDPLGFVKNDLQVPPLIAGDDGLKLNDAHESPIEEMNETPDRVSEIILTEELSDLLEGLEDYSHVMVIYWGHEVTAAGRKLKKVHPAGFTDYPLTGICSTYSPARPNPLLLSVVRLIRRNGNRLLVSGLDAINNSPVLDIKPYVADLFPHEEVLIPPWMKKIVKEFDEEIIKRRHIN
jgi:tRNA-Thr(GGU) m(6)t(6)A37 methyltransferase TsaA